MRHKLSPRDTIAVETFGAVAATVELARGPEDAAPTSWAAIWLGFLAAWGDPWGDWEVPILGFEPGSLAAAAVSGALNGTSARDRITPEPDSTSSSLTRETLRGLTPPLTVNANCPFAAAVVEAK